MGFRKIKSDQYISIGINIRRIRQDKNIKPIYLVKQLNLRGLTNMTKQRFYKIENDISNITASELVYIAEIMKVDIKELFKPISKL